MSEDRVAEIRVEGMRTLANVRLELGGLTVLIGENGTGKGSLVEAFELLRKAASPNDVQALNDVHGGLASLLRFGAHRLTLGMRVEGAGDGPLDYPFSITTEGSRVVVERESLDPWNDPTKPGPLHLLQRSRTGARYFDRKKLREVVKDSQRRGVDELLRDCREDTGDIPLPVVGLLDDDKIRKLLKLPPDACKGKVVAPAKLSVVLLEQDTEDVLRAVAAQGDVSKDLQAEAVEKKDLNARDAILHRAAAGSRDVRDAILEAMPSLGRVVDILKGILPPPVSP